MGAKLWKGEKQVIKFEYDFADQGGAIGAINLGNLPDDFAVTAAWINIETAMASGGTPTVTIGEDGGGDVDGYFADQYAAAAGALVAGGGALLSGGHKVAAANDGVIVDILTAALTAGKFQVYFEGFQA